MGHCWYSELSTATLNLPWVSAKRRLTTAAHITAGRRRNTMRKALLILGLLGLAIGLLWIGQGTGAVAWPRSSFMINEIQWAGYGAVLSAVGLILIWQSQRP